MPNTEQQAMLEPELGPMLDKEVPNTEITFSDSGKAPKITSIDERRLSEQISRLKSKDAKSASLDPTQTKIQNIYTNKNGGHRKSLKSQAELQPVRTETTNKESRVEKNEIVNYPVKASNSEFKLLESKASPTPIFYKSSLNIGRKRTFNEVSDTDEKVKSLIGDLREPAIPLSKLKHRGSKGQSAEEDNIEANINKARRRRDKERRKHRREQLDNDGDSSSNSSESSDNTVTSRERDDLIRKYFKKILCPIFQEEREQNK